MYFYNYKKNIEITMYFQDVKYPHSIVNERSEFDFVFEHDVTCLLFQTYKQPETKKMEIMNQVLLKY